MPIPILKMVHALFRTAARHVFQFGVRTRSSIVPTPNNENARATFMFLCPDARLHPLIISHIALYDNYCILKSFPCEIMFLVSL